MIDYVKKSDPGNESFFSESPLTFWKQQLSNAEILQIPNDHRPALPLKYEPKTYTLAIPAECLQELKKLSAEHNVSMYATMLTAYNILLSRYTQQVDIIVGLPAVDEITSETGQHIGSICSTKICRSDVSGNPTFIELLGRVRATVSLVNNQKAVQYEMLEDALKAEQGSAFNSLYNVGFSYQKITSIQTTTASTCSNKNTQQVAVDIALNIEETEQTATCTWTYNTLLFEQQTIERLAKRFEILLEGIVENPHQQISLLPLLSYSERHELLTNWSSSTVEFAADKCIHQLFEAQVLKTPGATAVVFNKTQLTYKELNERANQLAHFLIERGVTKETFVPICLDRSLEMIVGLLAILKAGGVYVPIDPEYPAERMSYIIEDTKARLIICNRETKLKLRAIGNLEFIEYREAGVFKKQLKHNPTIITGSNNLAYVIYTSGSTGNPKGVMIEHRSLVDHCYGVVESAGLSACNSFALFSPLVFDAGHSIIFSSLLLGATLHVLSKELILDGKALTTYLNDNDIDCIKIVPSLWLSYINSGNIVLAKKIMIFGGEAFSQSTLQSLVKLNYNGQVYNHYGPTEVTIGKCIFHVNLHKSYAVVPIGKPFSNTALYVLDQYDQLVPVGVAGELCIAGEGVARGYLNRPELTAEKFIANPFDSTHFKRLYKTGDKVRWLANGNLEYLGRLDEQVKVRGYRIELGEIEKALLESKLVKDAVVLAPADDKGNKQLVGYIICEKPIDKEAIKSFLRKKLPEYMVPALWVEVESFPLTRNSKIDKRALSRMTALNNTRKFIAAEGPTEEKLLAIFKSALTIDHISVDDDFFELGGNSLMAAYAFARIRNEFHKHLPLAILFEAPTIRQLATYLQDKKEVNYYSSLVPINTKGTKPPLFCIHAGAGTVLFYRDLALHLGLNQPVYGLRAKGINGKQVPHRSVEEMAAHYINEMKSVQPKGPYFIAGYCFGGVVAFEVAQQLTHKGEVVQLLATINSKSPTFTQTNETASGGFEKKKSASSETLVVKTIHRLARLKKLSPNQVLKYLRLKTNDRVERVLYRVRLTAYNYYINRSRPLPEYLSNHYFFDTNANIAKAYSPKVYPGKMIIFRSPKIYTDPGIGWAAHVAEGIETVDIPGEHRNRKAILQEPFVQYLAKELEKYIY